MYVRCVYVFSYAYSAGYSKRKLSVCHIIHMCNFNLRLMNTRNEAHPNTNSNLNSNSQFNFNCHRFGGDWWQFKQLRRNLCYTICAMTTNTHEVFRFAKLFLWRRRQRFLIPFSAIASPPSPPLLPSFPIWSELKLFAYALLTHIHQIQPHLTKRDDDDNDDGDAHV